MKRSIFAVVLCGVLSLGASAWALTLYGTTTNVGDRDDLVASAKLSNSGDDTELAWVQSILGTNFTMDAKYDTGTSDWKKTNEANTYALALDTTPEYFLIKTANGTLDHFLFKNLDELAWAVVNLKEDFGEDYEIKNVGKFSHVDEFSGGSTPVPEPSTMVLLGAGLLGVAICGKRRMNKA